MTKETKNTQRERCSDLDLPTLDPKPQGSGPQSSVIAQENRLSLVRSKKKVRFSRLKYALLVLCCFAAAGYSAFYVDSILDYSYKSSLVHSEAKKASPSVSIAKSKKVDKPDQSKQ